MTLLFLCPLTILHLIVKLADIEALTQVAEQIFVVGFFLFLGGGGVFVFFCLFCFALFCFVEEKLFCLTLCPSNFFSTGTQTNSIYV